MVGENLLHINTNAADDSKGFAFGLSGNLFLYVLGGAICSLLLIIVFNGILKIDILNASMIAGLPLVVTVLYVIFFVNNKAPHYQDDLFHTFTGTTYLEISDKQKPHPLYHKG